MFCTNKSLDLVLQVIQSARSWSNSALLIISCYDVFSNSISDFKPFM